MKASKKKLLIITLISGIIFLFAGIFLSLRATKFQRDGIKTQAEIVRIEKDYDANHKEEITVYVKYTVGDTAYTERLDYYASNLRVGALVPIYYLPDNPSSISYAKAQFLPPALFYIGGGVCLGVGVFIAVYSVVVDGQLKRLKGNGKKINAVIKAFDYNKNTRILGKHPATLTCADSSGKTYKRKFLCKNVQDFSVGDTIAVYVDNINENKYVLDIQEYLKNGM